jgi:penicillin-binding protein 2
MQGEIGRSKLFTRRALIVGGAQLALIGGLAGRMYQLQVVEAERYKTLADENRINMQLLPPPRGRIFDRFGQLLAENQLNYRLVLVPEQTLSLEEAHERILREASRKRSFVPITVRENLSWEEVSRIEVNAPDLPGVMIDVGQSRTYAFGEDTAHIVGYVGAVSEKELDGDPVLSLPGFRIGKNGVEKAFETNLRGRAGARQVEVNAYGRIIRELARQDGQPGNDYRLTIDMGLQQYASARFGDESGAAVVMDIHTGEILALASVPSYDPNVFTTGISQKQWSALIDHPRFPLTNKAIAGQYPPGSTFKMIVALAGLETGEMSPNTTVFCPGHITLGNRRFHCWRRGGHGQLGLDMPGERSGLMPTREWKMAVHGVSWQLGETLVIGIGQGYVLTTPLQLATMVSRIANGGIAITPHIVRQITRDNQREAPVRESPPTLGISPAHLAIVKQGMNDVTNHPRGTAYRARIDEPEFAMAGKTGSAQVRRISKKERETRVLKNEERPWEERDHALFVAYAPVENSRYAIAVIVEHGGGGSSVAAPIARDILREAQRRDPIGRSQSEQNALQLS